MSHTEYMRGQVSPIAVDALTVVIINWETPDLAMRCARAVIDDGVPPARIVLVDNGSSDDSVEQFERELPECAVAALETNGGYAKAANAGAAALGGEAYLILNSDAFVHRSGSIRLLLAALAGERIGIAVPKLLNPDLTLQPTVKPIDTPGVALVRASGLSRFIPNRWQPRWSTHWDHGSSRTIRAADGAVLLVRRTTWDQLGGFSPRAHMYAEDTDLCWRTVKSGWKLWFEAEAEFVHLGNATMSKLLSTPERAESWSRSEANLVREQLTSVPATLSLGLTAAGLAARTALFRLVGQRERSDYERAQLRGYLSALRPAGRQ
jgi:N-acetylglucosaminyl-diphospho-decaprenol L-rhamnosyltransferase